MLGFPKLQMTFVVETKSILFPNSPLLFQKEPIIPQNLLQSFKFYKKNIRIFILLKNNVEKQQNYTPPQTTLGLEK
jgi:hypothetical protein